MNAQHPGSDPVQNRWAGTRNPVLVQLHHHCGTRLWTQADHVRVRVCVCSVSQWSTDTTLCPPFELPRPAPPGDYRWT